MEVDTAGAPAAPGKRDAPDPDPGDPPMKELSAARLAQKRRRHAKKTTVVTGLGTLLDHAAAAARWPVDNGAFEEKLDAIVVAASQAAVLTCELLALHLALDAENATRDVDQAMCAAAMRLVMETRTSDAKKASGEPGLRATFFEHFKPSFPVDFPWPSMQQSGNVVAGLARDMQANFQVYHNESLHAHANRYLRCAYGMNSLDANKLWLAALCRYDTRDIQAPQNMQTWTASEVAAYTMVSILREHGPAQLHRDMLRQIERRNARFADVADHWSMFALGPLRAVARQFIVIDAQLLKAWHLPDAVTVASFFPRKPRYEPGAEVKTDGVRASLTYALLGGVSTDADNEANAVRELGGKPGKRAKRTAPADREAVEIEAVQRCLLKLEDTEPDQGVLFRVDWEAFDPGKNDLLVGHKGTKLSRSEWEKRRGTKRAQTELERRKRIHSIHDTEALLSMNHLNTADAALFKQRLAARHTVDAWNRLWDFYGSRWRARQRFNLKMREQRSYAYMANLVLGPTHTKVCVLGDAVFNASQKGLPPTPTLAIRRYLARFGRVVLVNEHRTSKTCCCCGGEMHKHPDAWKIFNCRSCKITWSRDANASRNIAKCYEAHHDGVARPAHLCRA